MRSIFVLVVLSLLAATSASAQSYDPRHTISVTGTAELKVDPDQVEISMSVQTNDMSLDKARSDNDEKVSAVLAMLKKLGIDAKDIQTDYLHVEPRYYTKYSTYSDDTPPRFLGYYMTKNITVVLKDISKYERLVSEALTLGTNYINSATFQRSDVRTFREKARLDAIHAAKAKATALAAELGQKIGKPITISEGASETPYDARWANRISLSKGLVAGEEDASTSVSPGQLTITAQVSVTFELE